MCHDCHNTPDAQIMKSVRMIFRGLAMYYKTLKGILSEVGAQCCQPRQKHRGKLLLFMTSVLGSFTRITQHTGPTTFNQYRSYNRNGQLLMNSTPKLEVIERSYQLTNCPSCMANMATLASSSGSLSTSRSALAPRA